MSGSDGRRRLPRVLGIDVEYYLKGGTALFLDYATAAGLGLVTVYCFTHFATKEAYGSYTFLQAIIGVLMLFSLPGMTNAVLRSASRGFDGALLRGVWLRIRFSFLGSLALLGIAGYFHLRGQRDFAWGCAWSSAVFPFVYSFIDFRSYLQGRQWFATYLLYGVASTAVGSLATMGAVLLGGSFLTVLFTNLVARSVGSAAFVLLLVRHLRNRETDPEFRKFARDQNWVAVLSTIVFHLDNILVGGQLGMTEVAVLRVAMALTDPIRTLGVFVNRLTFPRMVRTSGRRAVLAFRRRIPLALLLILPIGLAAAVLLPMAVRWFFPNYLESIPLVFWLVGSNCAAIALIYLETFYVSQERLLRIFYWNNVLRQVAMLALMLALVRPFGVLGVIWAKLAVRVASAGYFLFRVWKDKDLPPPEEAETAAAGPDEVGRPDWIA